MKKPQNIIETNEYVEPHTFENDREAVLFYAYVDLQKYVDGLELKLNNLLKPDVSGRSEQLKAFYEYLNGRVFKSNTKPDKYVEDFLSK